MTLADQIAAAPRREQPVGIRERALDRYVLFGRYLIKGWLHGMDARLITLVGRYQFYRRISGGIGEIGVHHGKLFILLCLLGRQSEKTFCIDVFDMQHLNVDRSGRGNEAAFRANVLRHVGRDHGVIVYKASSDAVQAETILADCGRVRLLSIDGGHTVELTKNDLTLADRILGDWCVVVVDDYFSAAFPGVSEGVLSFLADRETTLVPLAICENKIFFSRRAAVNDYRRCLREGCRRDWLKETVFAGHTVDVFAKADVRRRLRDTRLWKTLKHTGAGQVIRRTVRVFSQN